MALVPKGRQKGRPNIVHLVKSMPADSDTKKVAVEYYHDKLRITKQKDAPFFDHA